MSSDFDSPLGKKTSTFTSPNPPAQRRVFSVPDSEFDQFEIPENAVALPQMQPGVPVQLTAEQFNELQNRRNNTRAAQAKPTSEAKLRVELLAGIGRTTKEVEVDGHKFLLQSLKAKEARAATIAAIAFQSDFIFELRSQTLARSLLQIDGYDPDLMLGTKGIEDRANFFNECEEAFVNCLYGGYTDLCKEQEKIFNIKKPEDAAKLVEDVKKS